VSLQKLREGLKKGFYLDNLYELARICRSMALDTTSPAPFFIMEYIFLDIVQHWEGKPLLVEDAKLVEAKIMEALEGLIEGLVADAPSEEVFSLLNRIVSDYLIVFP